MQGVEDDREENMSEVVDIRNIFESDDEDEDGETQDDEDNWEDTQKKSLRTVTMKRQ